MNASLDIDAIVREVVARLRAAGEGAAPGSNDEAVAIPERIVTAATLQGRIEGVARVQFPARAVVTPAAKDLLRAAGVAWSRGEAAPPHPCSAEVIVAACSGVRDYADLLRPLTVTTIEEADLAALVTKSTDAALATRTPAAIVCPQAELAACLVNRRHSLRAAVVRRAEHLDALQSCLAPNVATISTHGASAFAIALVVRRLAAHGWPAARPEYRDALLEV